MLVITLNVTRHETSLRTTNILTRHALPRKRIAQSSKKTSLCRAHACTSIPYPAAHVRYRTDGRNDPMNDGVNTQNNVTKGKKRFLALHSCTRGCTQRFDRTKVIICKVKEQTHVVSEAAQMTSEQRLYAWSKRRWWPSQEEKKRYCSWTVNKYAERATLTVRCFFPFMSKRIYIISDQ